MGETKLKQKSKDSVFCDMFSMPKYLFQLYKTLHPEDEEVKTDDLSGITLKTVLSFNSHSQYDLFDADIARVF